MVILGVHFGHDSSAALVINGKIIGCTEEERFVRIKQVRTLPGESINFLLKKAGIEPKDVDKIVIPGKFLWIDMPLDVLEDRLGFRTFIGKTKARGKRALASVFSSIVGRLYNKEKFEYLVKKKFKELGFKKAKIKFYDHHLCHAASAFYCSPFDEALVVTQDGKGDLVSGKVFIGKNGKLKEIYAQPHVDSVGQVYAATTKFLGFKPNRHEGKLTGLAAYGSWERTLPIFKELFVKKGENGIIERNKSILKRYYKFSFNERYKVFSNHPQNLDYEKNFIALLNYFADKLSKFSREEMAAGVQEVTERLMKNFVGYWLKKTRMKFVCLAGGIFANVKVNQRIRELEGVENVFIQPAMGDDGLSLGAAIIESVSLGIEIDKSTFTDVYKGPSFKNTEIKKILESWKGKINYRYVKEIEKEVAKLIYEGKVVGRFNGALEWGPRALGNRSILVAPTDRRINDTLNKRLRRTEFMPFAPSVLDYRAKDYLKGYREEHIAAKFMTVTYDVPQERYEEIQAVVHVDGTARPQVVFEKDNPSYYKILKEYEKLSGIGCVVNTSFNLHEEPIVCTPEDALRALEQGAVDVLAIGNFLVKKKLR